MEANDFNIGCVDVTMCGCVDVTLCGCVDVWVQVHIKQSLSRFGAKEASRGEFVECDWLMRFHKYSYLIYIQISSKTAR